MDMAQKEFQWSLYYNHIYFSIQRTPLAIGIAKKKFHRALELELELDWNF